MSEFKKVPIFFDENKMSNIVQPQESRLAYFQELVTMYEFLNIPEKLEKSDLVELVENPKKFLARKIIKDEETSIGGLKLNFEKMFDIIEKPTGADELIAKIEADKKSFDLLMNQRNANYFEVNDNEVVLNSDFVAKAKEQSTVYIATETQQKAYNLLMEIAKLINELSKIKAHGNLQDSFLESYFDTNPNTETLTVKPYFGQLIR